MGKLAILIVIAAFVCYIDGVPMPGPYDYGYYRFMPNVFGMLNPENMKNMQPSNGEYNAAYVSSSQNAGPNGERKRNGYIFTNQNGKVEEKYSS